MTLPSLARWPIIIGAHCVGSVLPSDAALSPSYTGPHAHIQAVHLPTDCDALLAQWAGALHAAGRLKVWRDELLNVSALPASDAALTELPLALAQLERSAARRLGVLTHAVHLVGLAANGDVWLQHRAMNKATDPGLWDTLSGGLLSAGDSLHGGMLRETHEEAGLLPHDLLGLCSHGVIRQNRIVPDGHI
jgi:NUDIX domain